MRELKLNGWFYGGNSLCKGLSRFCVLIEIYGLCDYKLTVNDSETSFTLQFYNLEEAIAFTEETINKSKSLNEVIDSYKNAYPDTGKILRKTYRGK